MTYKTAESTSVEAALIALADPTRRAIVERLGSSPSPVGALARHFPVSRPAISQHLRVLSDAGLVSVEPQGTKRIYRLDPAGVAALREWLDAMWDDALSAFANKANALATKGPFHDRPHP